MALKHQTEHLKPIKRSALTVILYVSGSVFFVLAAGVFLFLSCAPDPMMGDFDISLTQGYRLERESPEKIDVYHESDSEQKGIPAKVVGIAWNDRFILAKQQELQPRNDFPGDSFPVPVPGKFNYWIIDVGLTNRYGPLSEAEFKMKAQALGQARLKLRDVYEFRKRDSVK